MTETLSDYRARTAFMWNSLPESGGLRTSASLPLKVAPDGHFVPFYGDTVIFSLPPSLCRWLADVQAALEDACSDCLAERLSPGTFHITLHDLRNQPQIMPEGTAQRQADVALALGEFRQQCIDPIRIRSVCPFSMVNTSLVMGFEPATEADCAQLMNMYARLQQLVPLSYPLTLHATLAYYRPGEYGDDMLWQLRNAMQRIGREQGEWALNLHDLHYATFDSMGAYRLFPAEG